MAGGPFASEAARLALGRDLVETAMAELGDDDTTAREFRTTYRYSPHRFAVECIDWPEGEAPTEYQLDILRSLVTDRRVSARGPHGLGKTTLGALVVLWFATTRDGEADWKVVTTASAWRQLAKYLWPEVAKWARRLRWDVLGREPFTKADLQQLSLRLETGEAFAVASDSPDLIEGAHADHILYVLDEAKAIPSAFWDAVEGALSGDGEALALAISTPGPPVGRFYEIHARRVGLEDWRPQHVTLADAIAAGRISREWADQRRRQWGETSGVYLNRVLGEFASDAEDGVIPLSWVEAANDRWAEWDTAGRPSEFTCVGVDVARSGRDSTVLALRFGLAIGELRRYSMSDTMETTGHVAGVLDKWGGVAVVDVVGIGAGVVDRLREQKHRVVAFGAAEGTDERDRSGELGFRNKRSAAWWRLRELLDPSVTDLPRVALPPDDELTGDLTAPRWRVGSSGRIEVESKDDIRKRLGRSTDCGDAVVQAFYFGPTQSRHRHQIVTMSRNDARHGRMPRTKRPHGRGWSL